MSIVLKLEVLLTKLNVMKKKVLFSVVFALMGLMGMAQDLKDLYPAGAEAVITPLPFDCAKGTPYSNPVPIDGAKVKGLPFYSYRDLNGTLKNTNEESFASVFRHFRLPQGNNMEIVVVVIERFEYMRYVMLAFKNGSLTDCLEAGFCSNDDIAMKQWRINEKGCIQISSLKLDNVEQQVLFKDDFGAVKAYRLDEIYEVNADGKFKRFDKVEYDSREYTKEELMDKDRNIWNL